MIRKVLLALVVLGISAATVHAKTYTVTLLQPATVAGTELKAGQYSVELKDQAVTLKSGKTEVSAPVRVETEDAKFSSTTVRYANGEGKFRIQEIRLGGTKTKLVLQNAGDAKSGGNF